MAQNNLTDKEILILSKTLKKITALYYDGKVSGQKLNPESLIIKNALLSKREIKIIRLICEELTSIEIGVKLGMATKSIENIRLHILKKIESKNVVGLVKFAIKHKIFILR